MKVLIVIPAFPLNLENIQGGVNSALSNLLKGFSNAKITIRLISFNREVSEPLVKNYSQNITIYYLPESKLPHVLNFSFTGAAFLKKHIKEFNPSIIHFAMSGYILLTRIPGFIHIPQIVTIHGIAFSEAKQKTSIKDKMVYYSNGIIELFFCPENIIHISKYSFAKFVKKSKKRFVIIPNAVNTSFFKIPLKPKTSNKILYVGSIEANKNLLFILKILKVLIEMKLFFSLEVLGDFTDERYKDEVLKFIKNNQLEEYLTLYGWQSQKKLQEVLTKSDILIVPSKQETLPMVIAEAMSAGKVVLCSSVGGIPEMVIHGDNGFLFDISSIDSPLSILQNLYNNDALIHQVQVKARSAAMETYHCDKVAQKTISFYQSVSQQSKSILLTL